MKESEIKQVCTKRLQSWGWMVIHLIQTNTNGIPDTLCLRNGRAVFIEFKQPGKNPEPLQIYRIQKLREQKLTVIVARGLADMSPLE